MLGPTALGVGRGAHNDVIARSGSDQTLGLIVRLCYSDRVGLLAVFSVTAGLKFSAEPKPKRDLDHAQITPAIWCRSLRTSAMKTVQRFHIRKYYIDDTDLASKRTFLQIQMLFSMRLSEATRGTQTTPLLTIPVK